MQQTDALEQHFGHALSSCEPPQFLRYLPGDFFVAHQDGNTPLIHDDSRFRKVSAVIFLSAFSEGPARAADARAGHAETTHEVLPVTHGERFTIVSSYW
jgi:SM-20-related protein